MNQNCYLLNKVKIPLARNIRSQGTHLNIPQKFYLVLVYSSIPYLNKFTLLFLYFQISTKPKTNQGFACLFLFCVRGFISLGPRMRDAIQICTNWDTIQNYFDFFPKWMNKMVIIPSKGKEENRNSIANFLWILSNKYLFTNLELTLNLVSQNNKRCQAWP